MLWSTVVEGSSQWHYNDG